MRNEYIVDGGKYWKTIPTPKKMEGMKGGGNKETGYDYIQAWYPLW